MKKFFMLMTVFAVLFNLSAAVSTAKQKKQSKKSESAECVKVNKKIEQTLVAARQDLVFGAKIEDYKLFIWEKTSPANGEWVLFKIPLEVKLPDKQFGERLVFTNPGITRTFSDGKESTFPVFNIHLNDSKKLEEFVRYLKQAQTFCKKGSL